MPGSRKKRFGDRKDGRLLRTLDPYNAMTPFIMKTKSDSSNYFADSVEISETERFLRKKRTNGYPGMGILHVFIAAFIRITAQYPGVNRFVGGQRIYARHYVELVMTIKKELKIDAPETSIKIKFTPSDTIDDVYHRLAAEIEKVKGAGEDTGTDAAARAFMKLPRLILKFAVFILNIMEYFGVLPNALLDASPFHGSVIITDLGSIGLPPIYHHLYNFGNMPAFISLGAKRKQYELKPDGTSVERKYVDYTLVLDERICDGFYFSQAYRLLKSILRNPAVLDNPPETVVEDIE